MTPQKIRVGVIGMGAYAALAHVPQLKSMPSVDLTAICRRDPKRLAMAAQVFQIPHTYTDWRDMLDQEPLDAVIISTPHDMHYEPALAALKKGLHVMVEKPMVLKSQQAWELVDVAQAQEKLLMVAYPGRLEGLWKTVKEKIMSGAIGQLKQINVAVSFYRRWFWGPLGFPADVQLTVNQFAQKSGLPVHFFDGWGQTWHNDPARMGGGSFMDTGTHYVDWMLWLADAHATEVSAMMNRDHSPAECFVNVQARLSNGVLCAMTAADVVPQPLMSSQRHLMLIGDRGLITDDGERGVWLYRDGQRTQIESLRDDCTEAEAFIDAIVRNDLNCLPGREIVHSVEFIEAIYQAAREQRPIHIATRPSHTED